MRLVAASLEMLSRHLLCGLLALSGCGGIADESPADRDAGQRRDSGRDTAAADRAEPGGDAGPDRADSGSSLPVYVEDACPSSNPTPPSYACDPFGSSAAQCPVGYACYPVPPAGNDPCNPGSWGTKCQRAGAGTQGSSCSSSRNFCAAGYVCVKSGAGDQCVKLCRIQQLEPCADGLVCNPLDVVGFGGCL